MPYVRCAEDIAYYSLKHGLIEEIISRNQEMEIVTTHLWCRLVITVENCLTNRHDYWTEDKYYTVYHCLHLNSALNNLSGGKHYFFLVFYPCDVPKCMR